jgi:hypothetical protein
MDPNSNNEAPLKSVFIEISDCDKSATSAFDCALLGECTNRLINSAARKIAAIWFIIR